MKNPPKDYKQTQTCCGKKLKWENCCRPGPDGCPDCFGAGGWWQECPACGHQPYTREELLKPKSTKKKFMLKLSNTSNVHEVWSESAAESVYVSRKPTRGEVTEIWKNCWPDTGIRPKVFRLQPFFVDSK